MSLLPNTFLLAAIDIGEIVTAVFFIVTFLGWIFQAISSNKSDSKKEKQDRQPNRKPQKSFEDEIEQFLQEVNEFQPRPEAQTGQQQRAEQRKRIEERKRRRAERQRQNRPVSSSGEPGFEIEFAEPEERSRRKQRSRKRSRRAKPQPDRSSPATHARKSITSRSVGSKDLGTGVSRHVEEHISKDHAVSQAHLNSLGQGVAQSVGAHLGETEHYGTGDTGSSEAREIRKMLSDKKSIRKAIILNEIFSKPLSIR